MIRNQFNRIPHPALNTKRERDGIKIKTEQVKSQGDSSFPTDDHKAILNKLNSKSKMNRKRTNIDRINHNRSIALEWSVINYASSLKSLLYGGRSSNHGGSFSVDILNL